MAKVAYSKLKLKTVEDVVELQLFEDVTIEVKQYLPIQEKLALIGRVVMLAHEEDKNFANPVKASIFRQLEMVFNYTNISFTDKQLEDLPKLYDQLKSSGVLSAIKKAIPQEERVTIEVGVCDTIDALYKYQNSALGILENIKNSYSEQTFDVEQLQQAVKELSENSFLKEIAPLIGLE
jgi:hypothetical protein